jgi:hypothetical protein
MSNTDEERRRHFMNALSNYTGVMNVLDRYEKEVEHNSEEVFPENWPEEPLLLLGQYLKVLDITEIEKADYNQSTVKLATENGAQWVWENRRRLAAEIEFLRTF